MPKNPPHLRLFFTRCTVLAFHALMWSFLYQSKPEFRAASLELMTEDEFESSLKAVVITGAVFLAILAIFTLLGISMQSIGMHFLMILVHALGIILVILSIVGYWQVRLLWIPAVLTCIVPALLEALFVILKIVNDY